MKKKYNIFFKLKWNKDPLYEKRLFFHVTVFVEFYIVYLHWKICCACNIFKKLSSFCSIVRFWLLFEIRTFFLSVANTLEQDANTIGFGLWVWDWFLISISKELIHSFRYSQIKRTPFKISVIICVNKFFAIKSPFLLINFFFLLPQKSKNIPPAVLIIINSAVQRPLKNFNDQIGFCIIFQARIVFNNLDVKVDTKYGHG